MEVENIPSFSLIILLTVLQRIALIKKKKILGGSPAKSSNCKNVTPKKIFIITSVDIIPGNKKISLLIFAVKISHIVSVNLTTLQSSDQV